RRGIDAYRIPGRRTCARTITRRRRESVVPARAGGGRFHRRGARGDRDRSRSDGRRSLVRLFVSTRETEPHRTIGAFAGPVRGCDVAGIAFGGASGAHQGTAAARLANFGTGCGKDFG